MALAAPILPVVVVTVAKYLEKQEGLQSGEPAVDTLPFASLLRAGFPQHDRDLKLAKDKPSSYCSDPSFILLLRLLLLLVLPLLLPQVGISAVALVDPKQIF